MIWVAVAIALALLVALGASRFFSHDTKPATANDPAEKAIVVDFAARKQAEAARIDNENKDQLRDEANRPPGAS